MTEATTKPTKLQALTAKIATLQQQVTTLIAERDQLAAAEQEAAEKQAARASVEVTGLAPDTTISFIYGRKDNRKDRTGVVVAFAAAAGDMPARYKVKAGDGFDAELLVVPARDVYTPVADEQPAIERATVDA